MEEILTLHKLDMFGKLGRSFKTTTALKVLDKSLAINPKDALSYGNRGMVKEKLGDLKGAIADYKKALEINPQFTQVQPLLERAQKNLN